jgi:hypothetical protein
MKWTEEQWEKHVKDNQKLVDFFRNPEAMKKAHDSYLEHIKDYTVYELIDGEKVKIADTHKEYLNR